MPFKVEKNIHRKEPHRELIKKFATYFRLLNTILNQIILMFIIKLIDMEADNTLNELFKHVVLIGFWSSHLERGIHFPKGTNGP